MDVSWLFARFTERSAVTVMVRATLTNAFSPATLDGLFAATARRQRSGELLFSSVVDVLSMVVWGRKKSINRAYEDAKERLSVSIRSLYNKLNGTEPEVCRAVVRGPAARLAATVDALAPRPPLLPGYRVRILDGNHLPSTQHRLRPLRTTRSGPLPGQALCVLDADRMLLTDAICCEDGHAQERSLLPQLLPSVEAAQLWIADRNFCTTDFFFGLAARGAAFVIRQHASTLSWERETPQKPRGTCDSGELREQCLELTSGVATLPVRRITLRLDEPTTGGDRELHLLTNLPPDVADAERVAELYLKRWTIENAFQELEQALRSEIDTLGYPGAALLGFAVAVNAYNALSVVKWAIEVEHRAAIAREAISGYYLADLVTTIYDGMLVALPPEEWTARYARLSPTELAHALRACATRVDVDAIRKTTRGPKTPRVPRTSGRVNHHVATKRLLKPPP